ncbi:unnamed protein product [Cunninghamella blakesleeana]
MDHVSLDLSQFNNVNSFDLSSVQWNTKLSTMLNGSPLTSIVFGQSIPLNTNDGYVIFGGNADDDQNIQLNIPFIKYDINNDQWTSLPIPNGNNYTYDGTIVDMNNGSIWQWGGYVNASSLITQQTINIFDYQTSIWTNQYFTNQNTRVQHTANLIDNRYIYILGGYINTVTYTGYADFNDILIFDTQLISWRHIIALGDKPYERMYHTTTQIPGKNLLIIYGGRNYSIEQSCLDPYYIYDISNNKFQHVEVSNQTILPYRHGHYATIYNTNFLVLMFGYKDDLIANDQVSILNIENIYQPTWINVTTGSNNKLSNSHLIAIIIVSITVPVLIGICVFIYIRRRKEKKKGFVLEPEASAFNNVIINNDSTANDTTNSTRLVNKPNDDIVTEKCKPSGKDVCCSVLQSIVYCYGGRIKYENDRNLFTINEHVGLDLKQLEPLNDLNKKINQKDIQWKLLSNSYMGSELSKSVFASSTPITTNNSYLIFGGLKSELAPSSNPFIQYNVDNDSWSSYFYLYENNFTAGGTMVNIGDDKIWMWGGYIVNNKTFTSRNLTIFDYKKAMYTTYIGTDLPSRIEHTATLARDNKIYIIGGYTSIQADIYEYAKFTDVIAYDTITFQWEHYDNVYVADHLIPSSRSSHTTVQSSKNDILLIYGGENLNNKEVGVYDVFYSFNTTSKIFTTIKLPLTLFDNKRSGHFATLYNDEYLVLLFGYTTSELPLDNIRVLNVSDLNNVSWLIYPDDITLNNDFNDNGEGGISRNTIIIVSVIVTFIVICSLGMIIWYFHKKNTLKHLSELENEDPRKKMETATEIISNSNNSNILNENNLASNIYHNLSSTYVNDHLNNSESILRLSQVSTSNLDKSITKPSDIIDGSKEYIDSNNNNKMN